MSRNQSAADYIESHATEMAIMLAELSESAGVAGREWALATAESLEDPARAMRHLAEAETRLGIHARLEVSDSLRIIRRAMTMLDREDSSSARRR